MLGMHRRGRKEGIGVDAVGGGIEFFAHSPPGFQHHVIRFFTISFNNSLNRGKHPKTNKGGRNDLVAAFYVVFQSE